MGKHRPTPVSMEADMETTEAEEHWMNNNSIIGTI